jgi:outer membrane protein assembly factor BamB
MHSLLNRWHLLASIAAATTNPSGPGAVGAPVPNGPTELPGRGLAEHDFFYAGEGKEERMFIVRKGEVTWSYTHPGKGEISDAVLLANGNVLFAHQFGITEITAEKKIAWNLDAPPNTEIHTAQPLGRDSVWYVQNGDPAKFILVNKGTWKVEREFVLPVKNPKSIHGQFRHARLTNAGTILVAHMDLGKAVEYDLEGKELWSAEVPGIWSATPLQNGNVLVVSTRKFVRELNRQGEIVWEWTPADTPEYSFSNLQLAVRLPNGNTVINDWFNQWSGHIDTNTPPVQAIEVTRDKKVVWALRAWTSPADLGPATTIQILDGY